MVSRRKKKRSEMNSAENALMTRNVSNGTNKKKAESAGEGCKKTFYRYLQLRVKSFAKKLLY
jgi:hypothetical protein